MLNPLHDNLIIEAAAAEQATASGIILHNAGEEKPAQGTVIAVGPGKLLENGTRAPMTVKIGDSVVFKKYSPDEVKIGGKEFLVISEADVLAVITK